MRISSDFKLRKLCKEHIVVCEGANRINFNKMLALNSTAAYLWEQVCDKDFTVDDLTWLLVQAYDVEEATAAADAAKVAEAWASVGVLEED